MKRLIVRDAKLICAALAAVLLSGSSPAFAEQSGTVSLKIDTAGKPAADGTPVSGGVPFPIGAIATVDHLRLKTVQGSEVPANYRSLVNWPDGSVKSALVSFVPTPQAGDTYPDLVLEFGPSVSHSTAGPVQVTQDAQSLTVTNGVMKLQFSKQRFTVLEQAWADLDSDGSFGSTEQLLSAPADLIVVDRKSGNSFKSSLWTAADGYTIKLVEAGPSRVTLLLEGRLKGVNGALTKDNDATLAQAKVWLSIFGNSPVIHAQTTIVDTKSRPTETFSGKVMDLDAIVLDLPTVLTGSTYAAGGESGAVYQGSVANESFVLQDATANFSTGQFSYGFSYSGVGSGAKAPGWMDISTPSRGITLGLRHFWQTYPHKLSAASDGHVQMHFVPQESNTSFWTVYPGVGKTYEGFLDLHAGSYNALIKQRAELMLATPILKVDNAWASASRVFGELSPPSAYTNSWETKMQNQYNCTVLRSGCSIYPQLYGQRDFGDSEAGYGTRSDGTFFPEYNDGHYEDAHGQLLQYVRDGKRGWFDYAVTTARHHYDLDVMHTQNPVRYPNYPAGMIHWHGTSEHEGVNIELGHAVPGGLDEYYYLTGDPRALEVIREQGDWIEYWARGGGRIAPERSNDVVGWEEYERVGAWTLYTVIKSYEATGDPKYLEGASILAKNTIDWWKMPQDHIVFNPSRTLDTTQPPKDQALFYERTDWTKGTGYPLATLRVANCSQTSAQLTNLPYQTHAPIAWMSGLLQMALIRYYEDLKQIGGTFSATVQYRGQPTQITIDSPTMREMLIQLVNTVVEYNYMGGSEFHSKYPFLANLTYKGFVYSVCPERDPRVTAGSQYLIWTLLYVSSFQPSEISSLWQDKWAAMQAKWRKISQDQYKAYVVNRTGGDTSANGAGEMLALPYAMARLESLGLLTASGGTTPPPPGGSGGGTTPPPPAPAPSASSDPAYQVTIADGNRFLTNPMVDLKIVAPTAAGEMNISTTGFGQGTWQQIATEVHGLILPAGAGAKTIFAQFRNSSGTALASLKTSVILLDATGTVQNAELLLNDAQDTYVFSNSTSSNFAEQSTLTAGKYDVGYDNIALLGFPVPALPAGASVQVKAAKLDVYLTDNTRNTGQYLAPYEITSNWDENSVTWGNKPSLASSAMGADLLFSGRSEAPRIKTFTLDPAVLQQWVQNPTAARGIALKGAGLPGLTSVQLTSAEAFNASADRRPALTLTVDITFSDTAAPVISGVQAASIGETQATIQWSTDEPANGSVAYGVTTAYGQQGAPQASFSTTHAIVLNGLSGNTAYHVRVSSSDAAGNATNAPDFVFSTTGVVLGDVNRDGVVSIADLQPLLSQLMGISPPTPQTADVNADGKVTVSDVQTLINFLAQ